MSLRRIASSLIFRSKTGPAIAEPKAKFDGAHSKNWWTTRDSGESSSAPSYWAQRTHPLRTEIGKAVSSLGATSLLEVGCHAGMNLWSASQFQKWNRIAGVELSKTVLDFARSALSEDVELKQAAADDLPFEDSSFDVVLTAGTLLCIGPDEIEKALTEICRVSRRWIVLVEPIEIDPRYATATGREDPYPNTMYWIRNYAGLLAQRTELASSFRLPKGTQVGHMDSISVFELRS